MEETAGYEERFSLGLEDVASYRDFFSAEEWDALVSGDWSGLPDDWEEGDPTSVGRGVDLDRSRSGMRSRSKEVELRSAPFENAATSDGKTGKSQVKTKKTSLTEADALRLADALDDYELVSVTDLGGTDQSGYWIVISDHRFDVRYGIESHCDYWDFIGALVDHRQCVALKEVA